MRLTLFDASGDRLTKTAGFVERWIVDRDRGGDAHAVATEAVPAEEDTCQ